MTWASAIVGGPFNNFVLQSLGMLVPPAGETLIRIFPALIADKAALDEGIAILEKAAVEFESAQSGTNAAE